MKLKRFIFSIVSYVMAHFSVISPSGGKSRIGSRDSFKCQGRASSTSFERSFILEYNYLKNILP